MESSAVHLVLTQRLVLVSQEAGFAITLRADDDGTAFGQASLVAMDEPGLWQVDLRLDPNWRGCGYGTEAAGALARVALEYLGALRVEMRCDAGQFEVARRLGFRPVGRVRAGEGEPWVALWGVAELRALAAVVPPVQVLRASGEALFPVERGEQERDDWAALGEHLGQFYDVYADDESLDVIADNCVVTLTIEKRGLRTWIVANASLPTTTELTPARALEVNASRSMATMATTHGRYVLRRAMLFAASQPWVVRHCIRAFDQEMAGIEAGGWKPSSSPAPLSYYAD